MCRLLKSNTNTFCRTQQQEDDDGGRRRRTTSRQDAGAQEDDAGAQEDDAGAQEDDAGRRSRSTEGGKVKIKIKIIARNNG